MANPNKDRIAQVEPLLDAGLPLRAIVAQTGIPLGGVQRAKKQITRARARKQPLLPDPAEDHRANSVFERAEGLSAQRQRRRRQPDPPAPQPVEVTSPSAGAGEALVLSVPTGQDLAGKPDHGSDRAPDQEPARPEPAIDQPLPLPLGPSPFHLTSAGTSVEPGDVAERAAEWGNGSYDQPQDDVSYGQPIDQDICAFCGEPGHVGYRPGDLTPAQIRGIYYVVHTRHFAQLVLRVTREAAA
jgi:hypothetical protein